MGCGRVSEREMKVMVVMVVSRKARWDARARIRGLHRRLHSSIGALGCGVGVGVIGGE